MPAPMTENKTEKQQARIEMTPLKLDDAFVDGALRFLERRKRQPTFEYLNALIDAFIRKVPWESVFRIVKRNPTSPPKKFPRRWRWREWWKLKLQIQQDFRSLIWDVPVSCLSLSVPRDSSRPKAT
jgi:hypothetical protein